MDHLKTLSLSELNKYAKALRSKIDEMGGATSTDPELQKLLAKLASAQSIIADKEISEAEQEATRRHMADALMSIDPRTYRPTGKAASAADREIPEELMHRGFVPGELEIGNVPISIEEIFQSHVSEKQGAVRKEGDS